MKAHLRLLGSPVLELGAEQVVLPTRKLWGLLAYLVVEGPTPRSKLAALLWEAEESRARHNLRGELWRLRQTPASPLLLEQDGRLGLAEVETDLAAFEQHCARGRWAEALGVYRGAFLQGLEANDAPELEAWLELTRETWAEKYHAALLAQAKQRTLRGQLSEALRVYERLTESDPLQEEGWLGQMRVLSQLDQPALALEQYRRYAAFLEREFGLPPGRAVRALAQEIRTGQTAPPPAPAPRLAGRSREWALLQEAWQAGQGVFLEGEAGIGKTRLLQDFAAAHHCRSAWLAGRPGDRGVPFASLSRLLGGALGVVNPEALPLWVRHELSHLLPDLGEEAPPHHPLERLRLFRAALHLLQRWEEEAALLLGADDLQFLDPASLEFVEFLLGESPHQPLLMAYRRGELPAQASALVKRQIEVGRAVRLPLEPLGLAGVEELLQGLGLPAQTLAPSLLRLTGGNPFFTLETLKLWQQQGFRQQEPPRSAQLTTLLRERLEGLPTALLELLWVYALAGTHFTPALAAQVLERSPLSVAEQSDTLERLGFLHQGQFAHDLLYEATLHTLSPGPQRLLHRALLQALEGTQVPAAVLLTHAQEAAEATAVVRHGLQAAEEARRLAAWSEALGYLEAVAQALRSLPPHLDQEARLHLEREEIFHLTGNQEAQARELRKLEALPLSPELASELAFRRGRLASTQGHFEEAAAHLRQSQRKAAQLALVYALEHLGIHQGAREAALAVFRQPDTPEEAFQAALLLAELALEQADLGAAEAYYAQAEALALQQPLRQVRFERSKVRFLYHTNRALEASQLAREARRLARDLHLPADEAVLAHNQAVALNSLHRTTEALEVFVEVLELAQRQRMTFLEHSAQTHQGLIWLRQGRFEEAAQVFQRPSPYAHHYRHMLLALALVHQGKTGPARQAIQEALPGLGAHIWHAREAQYAAALVEACEGHFDRAEQYLRSALEGPDPNNTELCWALLAFVLLQQNRPEEALPYAARACEGFPQIACDLPLEQIPWVYAQVLHRLGQTKAAQEAVRQAQDSLNQALAQLPPPQQHTYLQAFPYCRAIQEALEGRWPSSPVLLS
jgi:DNA-binding SARP family transcriptional activator